jgi:hypothetical protein
MRDIKSIFDLRIVQCAIIVNLLLVLSWLTHYTFRGVWADRIFLLCGFLLVPISIIHIHRQPRWLRYNWMEFIVQIPILIKLVPMIVASVFIIPISLWAGIEFSAHDIQRLASEDGNCSLAVRYRCYSAAFSHGVGEYTIEKSTKWFPFLEHAIYYIPSTRLEPLNPADTFIKWQGLDSILVVENDVVLKVR